MTLLDFFSGLFSFPVDDSFIISHCAERGIDAQLSDIESVDAKTKYLIKADLFHDLSFSVVGWQSKTASSAFESNERADAITAADRRSMLIESNRIYAIYGEKDKITKLNAINVWEDEKDC
jgi:hypothetical protein